MKDIRSLFIIAAVTLILLLPFLSKPFNMDDPFYIKMAQQIVHDPLRPYSFSINWSGELRDVWEMREATFPPLIPYYIAGVIGLFGLSEWVLHLCFLPFPLMAGIALFFIAKHFVRQPLFPALLCVVSPVFLVSSTGIMLDIPMLALLLAALAFLLDGVQNDRKASLFLSMCLGGLAILIKYTALIFFPLAIAYLIISRKKKYLFALLVPLFIFGLWCLHNYLVYGEMHFFAVAGQVGKGISVHKLLAGVTFFSGCLCFPLVAFGLLEKRESYVGVLLTLCVFVFSMRLFQEVFDATMFTVLATASLLFLLKVARSWRALPLFPLLWFGMGLLMVLVLEPWVSGRYFLVLLPPAALLLATLLERSVFAHRSMLWAIVITGVVGGAVATADYLWARTYPAAASYMQQKGYATGYFVGHFGFQYYMEKAGMEALEVEAMAVKPGYVVIALVPDPQKPDDSLFNVMQHVERKHFTSGFPVRVMNPWSRAGFYSSFWGIFPFSISRDSLDEFLIYRITG